jgi:PAS domain S-box-containing protein
MKARHVSNSIAESINVNPGYVSNNVKISFISYIRNVLSYLSNGGVKEGQKVTETKRIRLTNQFAIFGLAISLLELPFYIYTGLFTSVFILVITSICLSVVLVLSHHSLYRQAKILHITTINVILFYSSIYLGEEGGVYLYYFAVIILPFILFDLTEKLSIATCIVLTILSVYILEFNEWTAFSDKSITSATKHFVFQSSVFGSFVSIIFCVYALVKENSISEKRLGESETLFKGLLDATPDSTIITDNDGFITLCNKQVENIFGYPALELLGTHISVLIPEQSQKNKNAEGTNDLFITKKDGAKVAVELSQNSYLSKAGTMMIVVIRDITERKKHEQELVQFSYVVSHDLKAPLRAIFKLSEWIEEELGPAVSGNLKKNLQFLRGRVFRLEALINGLLEYAKVGRTNTKKETVNTKDLITEVIDILAPPSTINIEIQPGMPVFETPKVPFQQVFFNLLSNAIKYNDKENGIINIGVTTKGKFYEFSVQDNGIGIDPIYHQKVFVIFQTLEARDKVEGTGIGLAILKKSVEDMGGTIRLDSELGKGARFTFTWPK